MYLLVIQNLSGDDFSGLSKILRPLRFPEACLSWGGFWQERQDLNPRPAVLELYSACFGLYPTIPENTPT